MPKFERPALLAQKPMLPAVHCLNDVQKKNRNCHPKNCSIYGTSLENILRHNSQSIFKMLSQLQTTTYVFQQAQFY